MAYNQSEEGWTEGTIDREDEAQQIMDMFCTEEEQMFQQKSQDAGMENINETFMYMANEHILEVSHIRPSVEMMEKIISAYTGEPTTAGFAAWLKDENLGGQTIENQIKEQIKAICSQQEQFPRHEEETIEEEEELE